MGEVEKAVCRAHGLLQNLAALVVGGFAVVAVQASGRQRAQSASAARSLASGCGRGHPPGRRGESELAAAGG